MNITFIQKFERDGDLFHILDRYPLDSQPEVREIMDDSEMILVDQFFGLLKDKKLTKQDILDLGDNLGFARVDEIWSELRDKYEIQFSYCDEDTDEDNSDAYKEADFLKIIEPERGSD